MDARLIDYLATLDVGPDALDGWTVQTAQRAGEDAGFVVTNGPEIHFVAIDGKLVISRRNLIACLSPLLDAYGYVTTRVPAAENDHKLREVLGFEHTWSDENFSYWALTKLPFQRTVK
jgi:hypothetical protein